MAGEAQPETARSPWVSVASSLILAAGIFAANLAVFEPAWENTDDPRMALKVAGIASPLKSEAHLLYTQVWLGRSLASLHDVSPDVPWYGLYLLLAQMTAWAALLDCVFQLTGNRPVWILVTSFAAACVAWSLTHMQFTTSAAVVATAGALQILTAMRLESRDTKFRWLRVIAGWSLVVFASAMRLQSCYLIGAVLLPAGVIVAWQVRKQVRLTRHVAAAVAGTVVVFTSVAIDRHQYDRDPGWKTFREFERPFAILLNKHNLRKHYLGRDPLSSETDLSAEKQKRHAAALQQAGWNLDDLKLFLLWYSVDPEVHSTEKLQGLCDVLVDAPFSGETRFLVMTTATVFRLAGNRVFCLSFVFTAVIAVLFCSAGGKKIIAAFWILTFSLLVLIFVTMKLPDRVMIPASVATLFAAIIASCPARAPERRSGGTGQLAYLVFAVAAVWVVHGAWQDARSVAGHRSTYTSELSALAQDTEHFHVILLPGGFELLSPLRAYREIDSLRFVFIDGTQRSPTYAASLDAAGISNLSHAIAFNDQVRLVGGGPRLTLLKRFLKRHHHVDVEFVPERAGHYFTVNAVRRVGSRSR